MLLLVGLGNPGPKHAHNRHNVGFLAVDAIHRRHGFSPWRRRFHAEASEGMLSGEKCLLLKPQTFMNRSGTSVGEAVNFFKLDPSDVVVLHDEVDLDPGKPRMKAGGGSAGHNGLKSVTAAITDGYRRLRIGVGHPGRREAVPHYVLHDFAKADRDWLDPLIDAIGEHAGLLATGEDATFANRLNEALQRGAQAGKGKAAKTPKATKKQNEPAEEEGGPLARGLRRFFGNH